MSNTGKKARKEGSHLTGKQKLFCDEYLIDLNATKAAERAGYSLKTSAIIGHENLQKPNVAAYIQERMDKRAGRTEITQDRVLNEIAAVAFGDIRKLFDENGNLVDIHKLSDDAAKMVAGFDINFIVGNEGGGIKTTKVKSNDKLRSLEMLGRHLKLFTEKHEHTGANGGPILTKSITFEGVGPDEE